MVRFILIILDYSLDLVFGFFIIFFKEGFDTSIREKHIAIYAYKYVGIIQ